MQALARRDKTAWAASKAGELSGAFKMAVETLLGRPLEADEEVSGIR